MNSRRPFLILASITYAIYVFGFWLGVGFKSSFWQIDWMIYAKLCLLAFPIYTFFVYKFYARFFPYDGPFLLVPYLVWFCLVLFIYPKTLVNGLLVDPEIIFICSGLYFLIIPAAGANSRISRRMLGALLGLFLSVGAWLVANYVPALPE